MHTKDKAENYIYSPAVKDANAIPLWFCFPSTYSIGMSSLGYLNLFRIFDTNSLVSPERVFTDTANTSHSAKDVELIGFSFSFELDFLGVFKILDKYAFPKRTEDRAENHPLVFGGGPVLTANPEPYADFFDFIIVGEGEEILGEIVNVYSECRSLSRQEKLKKLAEIQGIYVPSLFAIEYNADNTVKAVDTSLPIKKVDRRVTSSLDDCFHTPISTENTMFSGMFLVEVARGCPRRCRFCLASYLTLPARYPDADDIIESIDIGLSQCKKIGLLGALITEHPEFSRICEYIRERRKTEDFEVSVSSLRADNLAPETVSMLAECGQKSSTVAVEAGSDRLRKLINKNLTREQILSSVKTARENGLSALKIYGMIGLPTETMDDIAELAELMNELRLQNKGFKLTLSISSFVPKAQTPFQWELREDNSSLQKKTDFLKKQLLKTKVDFKPTSLKWDYIQAVLSRGDRRLSPVLEKVYEFEGSLGSWGRAYKETSSEYSIPTLDWYALRQRDMDEILPWQHIDSGVGLDILKKDSQR